MTDGDITPLTATDEQVTLSMDDYNKLLVAHKGDTQHNLNESQDKIRLKTQLKRGDGTRDQDTHDINGRGETPAEAAKALSEALAELEERNVFERARNIQPEVSERDE